MNHHLLVTGEYGHEEFRDVLSGISIPLTLVAVNRLASVAEQSFSLIVLAEPRRNTIDPTIVANLRATHRGTPIVSLLGSWCEGERRSGTPLEGVIAVCASQFRGRLRRFMDAKDSNDPAIWNEPLTATPADSVRHYRVDGSLADKIRDAEVLVLGESAASTAAIADALKLYGVRAVTSRNADVSLQPDIVCFDIQAINSSTIDEIRSATEACPQSWFIAVCGFPRRQDHVELASLNVRSVVSKPFLHVDLIEAISEWKTSKQRDIDASSLL